MFEKSIAGPTTFAAMLEQAVEEARTSRQTACTAGRPCVRSARIWSGESGMLPSGL